MIVHLSNCSTVKLSIAHTIPAVKPVSHIFCNFFPVSAISTSGVCSQPQVNSFISYSTEQSKHAICDRTKESASSKPTERQPKCARTHSNLRQTHAEPSFLIIEFSVDTIIIVNNRLCCVRTRHPRDVIRLWIQRVDVGIDPYGTAIDTACVGGGIPTPQSRAAAQNPNRRRSRHHNYSLFTCCGGMRASRPTGEIR